MMLLRLCLLFSAVFAMPSTRPGQATIAIHIPVRARVTTAVPTIVRATTAGIALSEDTVPQRQPGTLLQGLNDMSTRIQNSPPSVTQALNELGELLRPAQRDPATSATGILGRIGSLINSQGEAKETSSLLGDIGRLIDKDINKDRTHANDMKDGVLGAIKNLVETVKTRGGVVGVEKRESVQANLTTSDTCPITPVLTKCCNKILVPQATQHCCGNIPVIQTIHSDRCCRNGAGVFLPLLDTMFCCNGLPYPKTTMKCCRTGKGNRPFPLNTPCPP